MLTLGVVLVGIISTNGSYKKGPKSFLGLNNIRQFKDKFQWLLVPITMYLGLYQSFSCKYISSTLNKNFLNREEIVFSTGTYVLTSLIGISIFLN